MFANRCRCKSAAGAAVCLALVFGCSEDIGGPGDTRGGSPPQAIKLTWEHPQPQGNDLNGLWGFGTGEMVAVGEAGTVLRNNGVSWEQIDVSSRHALNGVWGSTPADVYAVGDGGEVLYYDGMRWKSIDVGTRRTLYGVHGTTNDDVWVVGDGGLILHWNGASWARNDVLMTGRLRTVWAYSADEVYTGGTSGFLFRYDGSQWSQIFFKVAEVTQGTVGDEYVDMWGPEPGLIAAMTDGSYAIFYDGTNRPPRFSLITQIGTGGAVWGNDATSFVMVNFDWASHRSGLANNRIETGATDLLFDLWGPDVNDLLAVGQIGTMLHYNGTDWTRAAGGINTRLRDIVKSPANEAIAVGWDGTVLTRPAGGGQWQETFTDIHYDFSSMWCGEATTVAVGRYTDDPSRGIGWTSAIVRDPGEGFLDESIPEILRIDGVWGSSDTDIYAVGWAGVILHDDGSGWTVADSGRASWLNDIAGRGPDDIYAVGAGLGFPQGVVYHYDGIEWAVTEIDGVEQCYAVWLTPEDEAWVAADMGRVVHFDGSAWEVTGTGAAVDLFAITGTPSGDVWVAGWEGELARYDGKSWQRYIPNTHRTLRGAVTLDTGDLLFVGDGGAALRLPAQ